MVRMVQIGGVNIPGNKIIGIGLSYIYGIGKKFHRVKSLSQQILQKTKVNPLIKTGDLNDNQISLISQELKHFLTEGDLKQKRKQDIDEKKQVGCLRGKLHSMGKKVHGQSTRRNNRTRPHEIGSMTKIRMAVAGKKKAPKQG